MKTVSFFIPGPPRGKGRPRHTSRGGYHRTYTDAKTKAYERQVKESYEEAGGQMMTGPLSITILAEFEIPKSYTKRQKRELPGKPHTHKPDLDNVIKSILDGLNGAAYEDDSTISEIRAGKRYGEEAGVEVTIKEL